MRVGTCALTGVARETDQLADLDRVGRAAAAESESKSPIVRIQNRGVGHPERLVERHGRRALIPKIDKNEAHALDPGVRACFLKVVGFGVT